MPSPLDVPAIQGVAVDNDATVIERHSSDDEPFSALAFKIMNDPFVGACFVHITMRVYCVLRLSLCILNGSCCGGGSCHIFPF